MVFDQAKMWHALEERLATTESPRQRQMLTVVIEHAKAEADRSVERLMATLIDDPQYHFWVRGRDVGPKGHDAVRKYYEYFATSGGAVFESPKDRVVVDDHHVVTEAEVRNYVPGRVAKARGYTVPDEIGHYLVRFRNVVFFEFADDPTRALCEDSYSQIDPDAWERVSGDDLPRAYVAYLETLV
jgi:hypothetical protein